MGRPGATDQSTVKIGRYDVVQHLGRGGMAEILKAELGGIGGFNKTVVIKRILPEHLENETFVEMFLDEARLVANLNHPNIVQVFEADQADGFPYIVMEYVQGPTLKRLLRHARQRKLFNPGHILRLMADVCAGLEYAHRATDNLGNPLNIVHRDISPQNVVIAPDGNAKLLDFGVAKAAGQLAQTEAGTIKGKIAYVAPEHVRGTPVDPRADIFSMGVCLYEAMLGTLPYQGDNEVAILAARFSGNFLPPRKVDPNLPEDLERIILWAMAADPNNRCPDAGSLKGAIETYLHGIGYLDERARLAAWIKALFPNQDPTEYTGTRTLSPTNSAEWASLLFGGERSSISHSGVAAKRSNVGYAVFAGAAVVLLGTSALVALDRSNTWSPQDQVVVAATALEVPQGPTAAEKLGTLLSQAEARLHAGDVDGAAQLVATAKTMDADDPALALRIIELDRKARIGAQLLAGRQLFADEQFGAAAKAAKAIIRDAPHDDAARALLADAVAADGAQAEKIARLRKPRKRVRRPRSLSRTRLAEPVNMPPPPPPVPVEAPEERLAKIPRTEPQVMPHRVKAGPGKPRLPAKHSIRSLKQLSRTMSVIEKELVDRGGLPRRKARNVSVLLTHHLRQKFTPGTQIIVYPVGMYWTAVDASIDGKSRIQVAQLLKQRHLDGSLGRYRGKR